MMQAGGSSSIWDKSPYTMFRGKEERGDPEQEKQRKREKVDATRQDYLPPVISSVPPPGYFTEFDTDSTRNDSHNQFKEQVSVLSDLNTKLGRALMLIKVGNTNSFRNKEVKEQSKLGARFMDSITKVPLSDFWHHITEGVAVLILVTNVISAIYDLAHDPINLHYKVPNICFGVVENVLLVAWFNLRPTLLNSFASIEDGKKKEKTKREDKEKEKKKKKKKEKKTKKKEEENEKKEEKNKEKKKKYEQYVENILHEALLYPIIVLSVFGFANDKMYNIQTDWFSMLQFILIVIDTIDVLWTQIVRIIMIYRFLEDLKSVLGANGNEIGGIYILFRALVTTIANFVLFIFLILLLGAQVHTDNFDNNDDMLGYRGSVNSTFLLIAVIILPLFNLVVFIAVNYSWVVELLLVLGVESNNVASEDNPMKNLKQAGIMDFVPDSALSSEGIEKRLESMRNDHPFKRFISVMTEPVIAVLIIIWETILVLAIYYFDGCEHTHVCQNSVVQVSVVVIAVVTNIHVVLVALLFNVGVVVVFLALLVYPFSVPLFFMNDKPVSVTYH